MGHQLPYPCDKVPRSFVLIRNNFLDSNFHNPKVTILIAEHAVGNVLPSESIRSINTVENTTRYHSYFILL